MIQHPLPIVLASLFWLVLPPATWGQPLVEGLEKEFNLQDRIELDRDRARDRFEVSQANARELARRRRDTIRQVVVGRRKIYMVGRSTYAEFLKAETLEARAREPLPAKLVADREALEERWRSAWFHFAMSRARFLANRISWEEYWMSLYELQEIEVDLALTRMSATR